MYLNTKYIDNLKSKKLNFQLCHSEFISESTLNKTLWMLKQVQHDKEILFQDIVKNYSLNEFSFQNLFNSNSKINNPKALVTKHVLGFFYK